MTSARDKRSVMIQPNIDLQLWKAYVHLEDLNAKNWPDKWGWILTEYEELGKKLSAITETSLVLHKKEITDRRKILPMPNSTNHEYGWICSKPEFRLEMFGTDVVNKKIPKKYH